VIDFIASLVAAAVGLALTLLVIYVMFYVATLGACAATPAC
jgi:hypothetical protein